MTLPNDVREQQIVIPKVEIVVMNQIPTEGWVRSKYNVPYLELPYCYGRINDEPLAGAYIYLFRDKPLKDSRRRTFHPSPSTAERES